MLFLMRLSWKNLSRYVKRTLITASAIGFGLGLFLFMDSLLIGAEKDSERNLVWYETSSIRLYQTDNVAQRDKYNLKHLIDHPEPIVTSLRDQGFAVTTRTAFAAEAILRKDPYPEDGSLLVRVFAIDPEHDTAVYRTGKEVLAGGTWLTPGGNGAILGAWLAEDIGAEVGYPVTLVTRTKDGAFQTLDVEVVGLINTGNPLINRTQILIDQDFANTHLQLQGSVTQIDIAFSVTADTAVTKAQVLAALPPNSDKLTALSWRDLAQSFLNLVAAKRSGSSSILGLVFLIAMVGITNTMMMAMYERRRELGMMQALGMTPREIGLTLVFEAGGIGVIGGFLGLIIGGLFVWFMVAIGIDFSFLLRDMDIGYRISSVFHGIFRPEMFVVAFFTGILISMVVALIPVRQALKLSITDCLRVDN
jgi:putative ABC transport system permease protein